MGALIALSSYTEPRSNVLVDTLIVCFTNSFTSLFSSVIIFSIVGYKAHLLNISPELVSHGPGLAFVVFSQALTLMPVSPLWALLFFFMLFLLGLDSQFATMEAVITVIIDDKRFAKIRKELLILIICVVFFIASIPFVLGNGIYLFQLFDQFASTLPLLFIGLIEIVAISWIFGVERFFEGVQFKIHRYLKFFWWIVWTFISPLIMIIILVGSVIHEIIKPLTYTVFNKENGILNEYQAPYPRWAQFIGTVIILSSVIFIPAILIVRLIVYHRARKQMKEFGQLTKTRIYYTFDLIKRCFHCNKTWSPGSNGPVMESTGGPGPLTESTEFGPPYFHSTEEPPTPASAMSETSAESDDELRPNGGGRSQ
jgi:hypothetical protein